MRIVFIAGLMAGVAYGSARADGEQQPFIRDVTTGYLMQYSFLSPRPYCWPKKETVKLSGWDVDKRGGTFEHKPSGEHGRDFAFHNEWFKLVDTSTNAAVTLRHQFARQVEGVVTLEFRFKLPVLMEGACWQLRDMDQAAVSLQTANGHLCWEDGAVLMPYEVNREYGVRVVADITKKTADVFVDGALKGGGLPFVHPVKSLDFVLVKTGEAATGELFVNPVNVYKGYTVNETFVACGVGKVPAGWEVSGGNVQAFECGTKPDIFSLKLENGQARRRVGSWKQKMVFECRFLLPGGGDGLNVNLGGVALEGLIPYRSNFWYMAKVVADPRKKTAEVFLNGKRLPGKLSFRKAEPSVCFAGNLWIDDVKVYPWQDYPADYVPEPRPVKTSHLLGVQSCNLWREGTAYAGWDYVHPFRDQREPYLGWYDEGNPEVTDWETKWQVEHGIGFELHCWYRPNNAISNPIKDGVLDQGIIRGLFHSRYGHLKKFAIMYTNEGACETNPRDWTDHVIPYLMEYFFKDPRYLTVEGRPVFSIYHLGNWIRMFGGVDGARGAIQALRDAATKEGFPGIVVLMEERKANQGALQTMKSIGVDCVYAYTWHTPDAGTQRNGNTAQRGVAGAAGVDMLPSISMGWSAEPWGAKAGGFLPPADYQRLAQWVKDEFVPTLPADSLGRHMIILANWNEFGEGHFLMPSTLAGFGYLDALREVFTEGGAHEDLKPTDRQKSRFNVLYPRE